MSGYGNGYGGGYDDSYGYGSGSGGSYGYDQSYGSGYGSSGSYGSGYGSGGGGYGSGGSYGGYGGGRGRGRGRGGSGGSGRGGGRGGGGGRKFTSEDYYKDPESEPFRKLFIGGLSYDTTTEGLKNHFEKWGEVDDVVVMKDPNTNKSRGFGFITYKTSASIKDVQDERPHSLDGREVETKRAMPRFADGQSESSENILKLYVSGIKDGVTEDDIRMIFQEEGQIKEIKMVFDKETGKPKPYCFITFSDYDEVDKCVLKKMFDCNGKTLMVKKAQEKSQKQGGYGGGYGYDDSYGFGDYGGQGGYGGGPMRGRGYMNRSSGPYGRGNSGYGRGGGGDGW